MGYRASSLRPLLAACALFPWTCSAAAQTSSGTATSSGTLTVQLLEIDGETYNELAHRPLNAKECTTAGLTLHFRISGLPGNNGNRNYIELWEGASCSATTRKDTTTGSACTVLQSQDLSDTQTELDMEVAAEKLCGEQGDRHLWFLAVDSLDSGEAVTSYVDYTVGVDTQAPGAPSAVRGGSGESEIPVSWKLAAGQVEKVIVVWDASAAPPGSDGGGSTECSSSLLQAGAVLDLHDLPSDLGTKSVSGAATSTSLDGAHVDGDLAAVAVVAQDEAGNTSVLSNVGCIRVVPTTGFWDGYKARGGQVDTGCACSAPGRPRRPPGASLVLGLGLLLVAHRARRRRS